MSRIDTIAYWHDHFNEVEFNGRLTTPRFGLTRSKAVDGFYEYVADSEDRPLRLLEKARLVIAQECFEDEELLKGTILHEMIHQYQVEVLQRRCNHDAVFCSMARKYERKYKFTVR